MPPSETDASAGPPSPGKKWHTREESGIRLDRQLRWFHDGEPIEHPKIVEVFNQGLVPNGDGRFRLNVGNDWCFVEVQECAYGVVGVDVVGVDAAPMGLALRLTDRTGERLDAQTLALGEDGVLTCQVKGRRAKARFSRDAQFALGSLMYEEDGQLFLQLGPVRIALPLSPHALEREGDPTLSV